MTSFRLLAVLTLVCFATSLTACRDDNDPRFQPLAASRPAPTATNQDPGGFYIGTLHSDTATQDADQQVLAYIDEAGEAQLFNNFDESQYSTVLTTSGANTSGSLSVYDGNGDATTTGSFTGTVATRQSITGTYALASGDHGTLTLAYDSTYNLYTLPVTLATLADSYTFYNSPRGGVEAVAMVKADGTISGDTEANCPFTGTLSQPDPRYNMFRVSLTVTDNNPQTACALDASAPMTGLAVFYPAVGSNPAQLVVLYDNPRTADFAAFNSTTRTEATGPDGIYIGHLAAADQSSSDFLHGAVSEDKLMQFVDETTHYLYSGMLGSADSGATSATLKVYDATGAAAGTASFSGTIEPRNSISGTLTTPDGQAHDLELDYGDIYEGPYGLDTAAGSYTETSPRNGAQSTLTLTADGNLSGTNEFGCPFTGKATVPDPNYNLYKLTVQFASNSGCGPLKGDAETGLAFYSPPSNGLSGESAGLDLFTANSGGYWADYLQQGSTTTAKARTSAKVTPQIRPLPFHARARVDALRSETK